MQTPHTTARRTKRSIPGTKAHQNATASSGSSVHASVDHLYACPYCDAQCTDISGYTLHVIRRHGDGRVI